jgi:hypothetical protein
MKWMKLYRRLAIFNLLQIASFDTARIIYREYYITDIRSQILYIADT